MGKVNEGVRRLSLVLGFGGLTIWLGLAGYIGIGELSVDTQLERLYAERQKIIAKIDYFYNNDPYNSEHLRWKNELKRNTQLLQRPAWSWHRIVRILVVISITAVGGILAFFFPWGVVRTIAWIVDGFKQTQQKD